jgi:hypothetical protein
LKPDIVTTEVRFNGSVQPSREGTFPLPPNKEGGTIMSFQEALETLSCDERFKATVYAMNSLLIQKGVYTPEEFEQMFKEWAEKERARAGAAPQPHLPAPAL